MSVFDYAVSHMPVDTVIVTPMMERVLEETLTARGQMTGALWSGAAGAGKSTTARWLQEQINAACDPRVEGHFRCVYWETPPFSGKHHDAGILLSGLYLAVTHHPMDPGAARGRGVEGRVGLVLAAMRKRNVGLLIVDEAQRLTEPALDALVLLGNQSTGERSLHLTTVLVGSGKLHSKLAKSPHLNRRFRTRIPFKDLGRDEIAQFARILYPHCFDGEVPEDILDFLSKWTAGNPAELVLLLGRAEYLLKRAPTEFLTLALLRGAVLHQRAGVKGAQDLEDRGYAPAFGKKAVGK